MVTSRNEDILKVILNDGDGSELPEPQSREEALLFGILAKMHGGGSPTDLVHICVSGEYNPITNFPTITSPKENVLYFVPSSSGKDNNLFDEWMYVNGAWELVGSTALSMIRDVQVNGASIVNEQNVANISSATSYSFGVVRLGNGIDNNDGIISPYYARSASIKQGSIDYDVIVPANQHESTFYGLARAAGDSTQSVSNNKVGNYTESAKSAISKLFGSSIQIAGKTPVINAMAGLRYICGEVSTIDVMPPSSGIVDIVFESGATAAILTVPNTVRWSNDFDPTQLIPNAVYEIRIREGIYASATIWS